jgi:hypothetical protein
MRSFLFVISLLLPVVLSFVPVPFLPLHIPGSCRSSGFNSAVEDIVEDGAAVVPTTEGEGVSEGRVGVGVGWGGGNPKRMGWEWVGNVHAANGLGRVRVQESLLGPHPHPFSGSLRSPQP